LENSIMRVRLLFIACACAAVAFGCTSSSSPAPANQPTGKGILARIVGVGDSLTAGEQSGGLLGALNVTSPVSGYPGGAVPPGQENGFWSLLYQQATGTPIGAMYQPGVSPLPLIAGPGLGSQLVVTPAGTFAATHSSCDAFNDSGYSLGSFGGTRLNTSRQILDLGIPGITAHEALYMTNPLTGPPPASSADCTYPLDPADPSTALQPVVSGESGAFYPILGGFSRSVMPLTEVGTAVALRPTLATVWLGANDLLKYIFSNGQAPSDSPAQMQADITTTIQRLQATGARVVVANLPDVLLTPQFFRGGPTLVATLQAFGVPALAATAVTAYIQTTYGVGPGGYLTESGFFVVLQTVEGGSLTPTLTAGQYLTDAFAQQAQGLNDAYNKAIKAAARSTHAPLVDIKTLFDTIALDGGIPINPPTCCSLAFGGGILSWDGLHPSNTGYALVANAFIQTIDTAYHLNIPVFTPAQLLAISLSDPYQPLSSARLPLLGRLH
jgi:lysophospholipase L1-like esterase